MLVVIASTILQEQVELDGSKDMLKTREPAPDLGELRTWNTSMIKIKVTLLFIKKINERH